MALHDMPESNSTTLVIFPGNHVVASQCIPGYPELEWCAVPYAMGGRDEWRNAPAVSLHKAKHANANERIAAGESTVVTFIKGYGTHDNFAWIDWRETVRTVRIPVPTRKAVQEALRVRPVH